MVVKVHHKLVPSGEVITNFYEGDRIEIVDDPNQDKITLTIRIFKIRSHEPDLEFTISQPNTRYWLMNSEGKTIQHYWIPDPSNQGERS